MPQTTIRCKRFPCHSAELTTDIHLCSTPSRRLKCFAVRRQAEMGASVVGIAYTINAQGCGLGATE